MYFYIFLSCFLLVLWFGWQWQCKRLIGKIRCVDGDVKSYSRTNGSAVAIFQPISDGRVDSVMIRKMLIRHRYVLRLNSSRLFVPHCKLYFKANVTWHFDLPSSALHHELRGHRQSWSTIICALTLNQPRRRKKKQTGGEMETVNATHSRIVISSPINRQLDSMRLVYVK